MLKPITPQSTNRLCCLLLGPAGIGKTSQIRCLLGQEFRDGKWQAGQYLAEKTLVLSAESGLLAAHDLVVSGQVEGFEIRSLAEFKEALQHCQSQAFREAGYQWIFIDSLTEIAARCAEDLQVKYPSKTDSFKLWAEYTSTMTDIIKTFRDLPDVSVAFTCLVAVDKDEFQRRFPVPDISGTGLKNRLTSYFDESLVMERMRLEDGTEYLAFKTNDPVGLAKDRSGRLNPLEKPNLLSVKQKILSQPANAAATTQQ
ncbi:MAG: ATP-binding protein [Desulfovibrio sp.]|nr:ATP-binding protein [Desulfovibrio sp.]